MGAARLVFVCLAVAGSSACVQETTVIGDDRARIACEEAAMIDAPMAGCTTFVLESTSPYGCGVLDPSGAFVDEHAGSWVRLRRSADRAATLRVTLRSTAPLCATGGGAMPCPSTAYLTTLGDAPCTCVIGSLETYPISTSIEVALVAVDQEVLLEPLGATFEVSVCDGGPIGP